MALVRSRGFRHLVSIIMLLKSSYVRSRGHTTKRSSPTPRHSAGTARLACVASPLLACSLSDKKIGKTMVGPDDDGMPRPPTREQQL